MKLCFETVSQQATRTVKPRHQVCKNCHPNVKIMTSFTELSQPNLRHATQNTSI